MVFAADEGRAAFERLPPFGAEALQEPIEEPYSAPDGAFRDPSGDTAGQPPTRA